MLARRTASFAALVLVLVQAAAFASDGEIGLFFDTEALEPCRTISCNTTATLYVFAILRGASRDGIHAVEYKIQVGADDRAENFPHTYTETFDSHAIVAGSGALQPLDPAPRGVAVAWPVCQRGERGKVLIETVRILNVACARSETRLMVVKHSSTSNPLFQCPVFSLCDGPVRTRVCVGSNRATCRSPDPPYSENATCSTSFVAYINPRETARPGCVVGVEASKWGGVKALYQ